MPLSGTFDTMELPDLLQWIGTSAKTGTLTVSVETEDTYLVFQEGKLMAVGSSDPIRLDFGQVLLARGIITEEQLQSELKASQRGESLADLLVKEGWVSEQVIAQVQADHAFESVLDLMFVEEGSFHFSSGTTVSGLDQPLEVLPSNYLKKPLSTREIVFEGMRRLDEWNRIQKVFPNSYVLVKALNGESENPVWKELRKINEPISVGDLCLRMGGNRFSVYQKLFEVYSVGLIALDLMPVTDNEQTRLGTADMLCQNARVFVEEEQYDEAKTILSTAVNLDPNHQEARKLLREIRGQQLAYLYQQIPPHRVPLLAVDREELAEFQLNPRETYLVSRLSGRLDVATMVVSTPLGELETLRILRKFLHAGIIKFQD
jgi:hypothetical protein